MATVKKRGQSWRAIVRRKGICKTGTFSTKGEASAWAAKTETEILEGNSGGIPDKTFGDLLTKYGDEISITKRGKRWEVMRIALVQRDDLASVALSDLNATHVVGWRDRRLKVVTAASVRREWNLLSHACNLALKEWKWLKENPFSEVRRPPPAEARDRRITEDEIERLLYALGYGYDSPPRTTTSRVGAALLFAIETAMRAGEIVGLQWEDVFVNDYYLKTSGKTLAAKRQVPLSPEAIRILNQLEGVKADGESVFRISSTQTLDALFRKAKGKAVITDLHFHDSRHEAITRLARKFDVLALARAVGHRDLRMLQVYYNESATDLAKRLQ